MQFQEKSKLFDLNYALRRNFNHGLFVDKFFVDFFVIFDFFFNEFDLFIFINMETVNKHYNNFPPSNNYRGGDNKNHLYHLVERYKTIKIICLTLIKGL